MAGYIHTQSGPLCLILYGSALVCITMALIEGDRQESYVAGGVSLLLALTASTFHHLTVMDNGEVLEIRFGPVPLFRRMVRYADMERVETGRTLILDGWGIHWSIRGGWVWNLWGRDCVVVHLKKGLLRIGSDDVDNLARFLEAKIAQREMSEPWSNSSP